MGFVPTSSAIVCIITIPDTCARPLGATQPDGPEFMITSSDVDFKPTLLANVPPPYPLRLATPMLG